MSQQELLKRVVEALDLNEVDYMITGSTASSLQGEPRSTHDIDVVVAIQETDINQLIHAFPPPDYYLDAAAIREAIAQGSMFNLLDVREGDKVDFWMLTNRLFDQSRFARKYEEEVLGMKVKVSRPEDTILAKLQWAALSGGSEKQLIDAMRVYEVQHGDLDMGYLREWAEQLHVGPALDRIKKEAEPL